MEHNAHKVRLTCAVLAIASLIALSVLGALMGLIPYPSEATWMIFLAALLAVCALLCTGIIFLFSRYALTNLRALEALNMTDSLTALPNRQALFRDINHAHEEYGEERQEQDRQGHIALALIDLDGFKQINDYFGHVVGDKLICECARLLKELCEPEARCYRLGGDEFAVVMIDPFAGTVLEGLTRHFLEHLERPIDIGERTIVTGASAGLAQMAFSQAPDATELLRRADVAMYVSKSSGKMRSTWFSKDFDIRRKNNQRLDDKMREALKQQEFRIEYQPIIDARTEEPIAVEPLLRWRDKEGTEISPGEFIPAAEDTGMIVPIGLWVLRQACTDAVGWDQLTLSVNISAIQLKSPDFPIKLGQVLEETGFPASRLELEITETSLVDNPQLAKRNLDVIRALGVQLSLDDFGAGYASIGFLRQFCFQKLKLDRSLIVHACEDESTRAMMVSSVLLARALNMVVTAEGVEDQNQAQLARSAGCDQLQGWLFFKPMSAEKISTLMATPPAAKKQSA